MEKSFILSQENKYYRDLQKYINNIEIQNKFIKEFLKENNIDGTKYYMGGNGGVDCPFDEYNKNEIYLYIESTKDNTENFGNILGKINQYGVCSIRRNSKLGKRFAQKCINEKIIINVDYPDLRFYFKTLDYGVYSRMQFFYNNKLYLKVISDYLKDNDIPEGCAEIKLSEFYKIKEEYEDSIKK